MTHTQTAKLVQMGKALALIGALLSLGACAASKSVVTVDDSADYQSARALPALKKPSRVLANTPAPQVESSLPVAVEPAPISGEPAPASVAAEAPVQSEDISPVEQSTNTADAITEPAAVATTTLPSPAQAAEAPVDSVEPVAADSSAQISAKVVASNSGQQRLQIESEFEQAWAYLSRSLQKSDITIFSRNKAAGRFAIGCGDIETAPKVEKKGGWSFFNREKGERLEYCALQAIEKRGVTVVSVLNRAGVEVPGDYGSRVFARILNN